MALNLLLAAVTVVTESEVAWLFLAAGVLVWFWRAPPKWVRQGRVNAIAAAPIAAASGLLSAIISHQVKARTKLHNLGLVCGLTLG